MISEELQYRVHRGEREAFQTLYSENARDVYLRAFSALADENRAKETVKRVFAAVYRELRAASGPVNLDQRIAQLTGEAIAELQTLRLSDPAPAPSAWPEEPATQPNPAPEPDPLPPPPVRDAPPRRKKRRGNKAGNVLLAIVVLLLSLLILWIICGILMDLGVLPYTDLGYQWFNETVYPLFSLGGGAQ